MRERWDLGQDTGNVSGSEAMSRGRTSGVSVRIARIATSEEDEEATR